MAEVIGNSLGARRVFSGDRWRECFEYDGLGDSQSETGELKLSPLVDGEAKGSVSGRFSCLTLRDELELSELLKFEASES